MGSQDSLQRDPVGPDSSARVPGMPGHDEWLIDEALAETFPASDAPSPVRPGSTVATDYARARPGSARTRSWPFGAPASPWPALVFAIALLVVLLRRRGR